MPTPYMNLDLPVVSSTVGPTWATKINTAITTIDSHDHSSGKGVKVPTSGLNINGDLSFGDYDLEDLGMLRFTAFGTTQADLAALYVSGVDLYYTDGSGNAVRITESGAISGASTGSITGLPSGTASVNYAAAAYTFSQATNQKATMNVGPVTIHHTTALALGITIKSPSGLAGAYDITLPSALPAAQGFVTMGATGVLEASSYPISLGIGTAQIAANAVTRAKLASVGEQTASQSSATFGPNTSTSYTNITGLTVSITTTGRPVIIMCVPQDTYDGYFYCYNYYEAVSDTQQAQIGLRVNVTGSATTTIGETSLGVSVNTATPGGVGSDPFCVWPASSLFTFYAPSAGTYTFYVQGKLEVAGGATAIGTAGWGSVRLKLVAYEL